MELTADGRLLARWMLDVGMMRLGANDFYERSEAYEAPVGTVEQDATLDRFVTDLTGRLTAALAVFVEKAPAA